MRALIPGYLLSLLLACYLGRRVFWTPRSREWAFLAMAAAVLAGACNIAQDLLLLKALGGGLRKGALLDWTEALSFVKFAALLVAGVAGVVAVVVTIGRLAMSNRTRNHWEKVVHEYGPAEQLVIPPPVIENPAQDGGAASSWRLAGQDWWDGISTGPHARWAQGFASPSSRAGDAVGVCVSGGGIRSATVALGALGALREKGVLGDADYLVSVSGGGYTVGGLQLESGTKWGRLRQIVPLAWWASSPWAGAQGGGRNQMAKCGLSETRRRPATATMSFRAWQSAMTAK